MNSEQWTVNKCEHSGRFFAMFALVYFNKTVLRKMIKKTNKFFLSVKFLRSFCRESDRSFLFTVHCPLFTVHCPLFTVHLSFFSKTEQSTIIAAKITPDTGQTTQLIMLVSPIKRSSKYKAVTRGQYMPATMP